MADFIITIRPEPDASRDVGWLNRYQVPAIALPVMQAKKQPFNLPDAASFQAIILLAVMPLQRLQIYPNMCHCGHCRCMRWDEALHWLPVRLGLIR